MMEIELPKLNPSQQDMDMIDILWKQDIDLGAGREVFDFSYRQKEHELQKQRDLEEEKRRQMLLEREKALLAQLQLDEETGEFVPRSVPSGQPQSASDTPSENVGFTVDGDAMSFDECMELLAQTFPLVESSETASTCLGTATPPTTNSQLIMAPEQPPLAQTPLLPATQKSWPDLDQAWMELLSIPELQQCLNMQMPEITEPSDYLSTNSAPEDPSYGLFMPGLTDTVVTQPEVCPPEFMGNYEVSFPGAGPANLLSQMSLKAPDTVVSGNTDEFCEMFYPDMLNTAKVSETPHPCNTVSGVCQVTETPDCSPVKPLDMRELSSGDPFEMSKGEMATEFPDSDSGLSLDASPNMSSPEKSTFEDGSLGFSDSDMDDTDSGPGSESDYSEMFSLPFETTSPSGTTTNTPRSRRQDRNGKHHKTEPAEASGHSKPPFSKDKAKRRSESRLSRDEQRAKTLRIPFTVSMIINLPVDDFNELMSKHQLNEPQLALVRDIRRRGKNKVAAQNCRKRKMENIVGLEFDLDSLKEERERLQREKTEHSSSLRQMKQQLNSLYLEVFGMLRDEQGRPYSPADYSLQQTSDGNVFLVPRVKKTLIKSDG
ncbi:nuclear factor erythroid 2-related factor 2a isoform X2 [Clupea harengus]|uniref:Nuclear factor erythroid 2-related factor 2a isoform X2 n=1 Tax=Clupea harengus TaxID=7950 RepID=A0A6P3W822_CLUHA|nr:nuclear factor erythroid 2-related factor 2a isoform X2 [Clupea harengus]